MWLLISNVNNVNNNYFFFKARDGICPPTTVKYAIPFHCCTVTHGGPPDIVVFIESIT